MGPVSPLAEGLGHGTYHCWSAGINRSEQLQEKKNYCVLSAEDGQLESFPWQD